MTSLTRVAVVVTCHNRRQQSLRSVGAILGGRPTNWEVRVFAVDDGSDDGTSEALTSLGGEVEVIRGSGDLFWAGGMRLASSYAQRWRPDFFMWLNDDVEIEPNFLRRTAEILGGRTAAADEILVGPIVTPDTGEVVYGVRQRSARSPIAFELRTNPSESADTFNGNVVLFGASAYSRLGGFPAGYHHGYADFIMGVRASRAHVPVVELPFPAGYDYMNERTGRMYDTAVNLLDRIRFAVSPFGIPPRDQLRFCREIVGGVGGWMYFFRSYARVVLPRRSA